MARVRGGTYHRLMPHGHDFLERMMAHWAELSEAVRETLSTEEANLVELSGAFGARRGLRRPDMGGAYAAARLPAAGTGGLPQAVALPVCSSVGSTTLDVDGDQRPVSSSDIISVLGSVGL